MHADTIAADEEALLAAEAFSFGLGDAYLAAKKADVERRIYERYPNAPRGVPGTSGGAGSGVVDSTALGGVAEHTPNVG